MLKDLHEVEFLTCLLNATSMLSNHINFSDYKFLIR